MKDDLRNLYDWSVKCLFNPDPNKPAEEVVFTNISSYETVSHSGVDGQPVESQEDLGLP